MYFKFKDQDIDNGYIMQKLGLIDDLVYSDNEKKLLCPFIDIFCKISDAIKEENTKENFINPDSKILFKEIDEIIKKMQSDGEFNKLRNLCDIAVCYDSYFSRKWKARRNILKNMVKIRLNEENATISYLEKANYYKNYTYRDWDSCWN